MLGISFITEGAIPCAAREPLRVIPALIAGSAVTGAISMARGCQLRAPLRGIFVQFIPTAVTNLPIDLVALLAGTLVSTAMLGMLKKPVMEDATPTLQTPVSANNCWSDGRERDLSSPARQTSVSTRPCTTDSSSHG
ncbi:hypothetical protein [Deinococcus navajonensis]|uniref:Uncharacterized protein n=1 Tax=Deinococcus navajonensis TaxID=309884 RepID=A0ABV8XJN3_9DEIO